MKDMHKTLFMIISGLCMGWVLSDLIVAALPPIVEETPATPPIASTPSPTNEPAPSQVDFENMAGLDAATQELLNERYGDAGSADFEKRLRRLEWSVSALSDRVFGMSLLPGEGQIGELGSDGESGGDK
jgi:hypothetical protein